MDMIDRIKELCLRRGITRGKSKANAAALARSCGINEIVMATYFAKTQPLKDIEKIEAIAHFFNVSANYLRFGKEPEPVNLEVIKEIIDQAARPQDRGELPKDHGLIPVLSIIPAGEANAWIDDFPMGFADDYIPSMGCKGEHIFALKVKGDSMSPRLLSGDIIVVNPELDFIFSPRGKIGVVQKNQEEAMVKWVRKRQDMVCIESENPAYKDTDFIIKADDPAYRFLKIISFKRATERDEDF